MKVLAVDDEAIMLERLRECICEVLPQVEVYDFRRPSAALAFAADNPVELAFLDIEMRGMDGITLGKKLSALLPQLNIIYTTAYADYAFDAYQLNASGYLLKPIDPQELRRQLECLRYPVPSEKRLSIQCFGSFEARVEGKYLSFKYERTRELLAYLVDRCGASCGADEIMSILWEDETHLSYFQNLRKDLQDTLRRVGCGEVLEKTGKRLAIKPELVCCDYYQWRDGSQPGIDAYRGEYMTQYSWAEETNGMLSGTLTKAP
ncbi:response regulator [Oscillibacter ruminantium]|jgi:two-component SAPR family response regulator|nr:response regulator [Oscillibacter valericigenes]